MCTDGSNKFVMRHRISNLKLIPRKLCKIKRHIFLNKDSNNKATDLFTSCGSGVLAPHFSADLIGSVRSAATVSV